MGDGEPSEMIRSVNQLIKWVGVIIIPVGAVLFSNEYGLLGRTASAAEMLAEWKGKKQ